MSAVGNYDLRRPIEPLGTPYIGEDQTFASERHDDEVIQSPRYQHCTFANLSFKNATLKSGSFDDCIFIGCYFRRAELRDCRFVGCRFYDCNFSHVALKSCDFRYSIFRGCQIAYSEFEHNLPSEPNLREDLARNLSVESSRLGLSREARSYRMAEIQAHEQHLKAAFQGSSQWYRDHFDSLARVQVFAQWFLSLLNRWLWGYGQRAMVLVRNLFFLSFGIFPISFFMLREQLSHSSGKAITFVDTVYFSLGNVVPAGVGSEIVAVGLATRVLAGLESLFGVVAIALFATYVFRWSLHR